MIQFNKINLIALVITIFSFNQLSAQSNVYKYSLDLNKPVDDELMVTLETPEISQKTIKFYMPQIIPGTYRESDYGQFVTELKAFDKKGRSLPVKRLDTNSWEIEKANRMTTLTYMVEDIFDTEKENQVYMMSATNIEANKNFVIHTPGFFGYFENKKEQPFEISITKPENFYGSTGLIPVSSTATKDVYQTGDYDLLVDSPMMYNVPDTTFIEVGNTEVLVSVYSPNKVVTSEFLAKNFEKLLLATAKYLDGKLPVDKYAFILYFADPETASPMQGALEHSYSSFYYISETPQEQIISLMVDIAAHEFFHIVTPLTVHSEEIENFNFNEPDLSRHLWLYEGVTEYFSDHVQVRYNIITEQKYLDKLATKINLSKNSYNDNLPFTELSEKAAGEHSGEYGNVYEKGALIAAMLDLQLIELSKGKMDLEDLLQQLSEKYGKNRPFEDEALFDVITQMTYPAIGEFLKKYVAGPESIPYDVMLDKAGIEYVKEPNQEVASIGQLQIGYNAEMGALEIGSTESMNEFGRQMGYQTGDLIRSIQGNEVTITAANQIFEDFSGNTKAGDTVVIEVDRKNEAGEYQRITLSAPAFIVEKEGEVKLNFDSTANYEQLKLRDLWLKSDPSTARPEDVASVDATIQTLYDVISGPAGKRNWERFYSLFKPDAKMSAFSKGQNGNTLYSSMTPEEYKTRNDPFFSKSGFWEEELGRDELRFGKLVHVFSAYAFRLSEEGEPEQRGINSIQLVYDQNRWWIASLIWNTESDTNKIPDSLLGK